MKVLQHINKLFCTLLFFSVGNKSYSQREIHPLEPMFTYDYALKYNKTAFIQKFLSTKFDVDYYFLENFKAPIGINSIEMITSDHGSPFIGYSLIYKKGLDKKEFNKVIFYYNEDGFIEKSVEVVNKNKIKNQYTYRKLNGLIEIIASEHQRYTFDTETGNLLQLVNKNDTIDFIYSSNESNLITKIQSKKGVYTFLYNEEIVKTRAIVNNTGRENKNQYRHLHIFLNEIAYKFIIGNIFFDNKQVGHFSITENYENSDLLSIEERFSFDQNQTLYCYYLEQNYKREGGIKGYIIDQLEKKDPSHPLYPSYKYKKRNNKKWNLISTDDKKLGVFKLTKKGVYFNNISIVQYN